MSLNLSTDAIKIKISVGQPTPKRKLPTISEETALRHGVEAKIIDTHITVLRKDDVEKVQRLVTSARDYLKAQTSPWTDDGWRLLMLNQRNKVTGRLNEMRDEFNTLTKEAILDRYDEIKADAKTRLNGLFHLVKFPDRHEMMEDYRWEVWEEPIGSADNAPAQIADATKKYYEGKIEQAQTHVLTKMEDVVRRVCALSIDGTKRFHDTIIENIKEELEVLPILNITGDDKIAGIIERLKKDLASIKPDNLRKSREERVKAVTAAKEILSGIIAAKGSNPEDDEQIADVMKELAQQVAAPVAAKPAKKQAAPAPAPTGKVEAYESKTMCALMGIEPPRPITRQDVDNFYSGMPKVADGVWKSMREEAANRTQVAAPMPDPVEPEPVPEAPTEVKHMTDEDIFADLANVV